MSQKSFLIMFNFGMKKIEFKVLKNKEMTSDKSDLSDQAPSHHHQKWIQDGGLNQDGGQLSVFNKLLHEINE